MPNSAQYPEILLDLADCFRQRLRPILPADQVDSLALAFAEDVRHQFGGCLLYIPKGDAFERARRNEAIVAEFDGSNHAELARRYRIGVSAIYEILRKAGELRERWGMARNYANKMIAAAEVVTNLGTLVPSPESERQARPLTRLEPEVQRETTIVT